MSSPDSSARITRNPEKKKRSKAPPRMARPASNQALCSRAFMRSPCGRQFDEHPPCRGCGQRNYSKSFRLLHRRSSDLSILFRLREVQCCMRIAWNGPRPPAAVIEELADFGIEVVRAGDAPGPAQVIATARA